MKHSKSLLTSLAIVLTVLFSIHATAQSKHTKKDFYIAVEKTDTGVTMKCLKGCAWTDLSFSVNGKKAQSVDQHGMFSDASQRQTPDAKFLDFEFSITRENDTYILKGLKGTSWQALSFKTTNGSQFFNSKGLLKAQ